jgi:Cft2 family RNA processing exonuclease
MKLIVAGGCGEHGRNCFYVEGNHITFLVDCGTMPGEDNPYPRLSGAKIQATEWLFLTHSHVDHTGAFSWLCEQGFSGCVVMTKETAGQLPFSPSQRFLID